MYERIIAIIFNYKELKNLRNMFYNCTHMLKCNSRSINQSYDLTFANAHKISRIEKFENFYVTLPKNCIVLFCTNIFVKTLLKVQHRQELSFFTFTLSTHR